MPTLNHVMTLCLLDARVCIKQRARDHVHYTDLLAKFSIRVLYYCSTRL